MNCAEVRDRLTEHALGVLPAEEAVLVEHHVDGCAACRRDLRRLHEGVEVLGRSLDPVEPSASLAERVAAGVTTAAVRASRPRPSAHLRPRLQLRRLAAVTLAAALAALLSLGWAFAERQHAGDIARATARRVGSLNGEIAKLVARLGGNPYEARLIATSGNQGFGTAIIVSAPRKDNFLLVDVVPIRPASGPYTVRLQTRSGRILPSGTLKPTDGGDLIFFDYLGDDLSQVQFVQVLNRDALPVLTGRVVPYSRASSG